MSVVWEARRSGLGGGGHLDGGGLLFAHVAVALLGEERQQRAGVIFCSSLPHVICISGFVLSVQLCTSYS